MTAIGQKQQHLTALSATVPRWISTRGASPAATFTEALQRGLAPDGGLYVPESWPAKPVPRAFDLNQSLVTVGELLMRTWIGEGHGGDGSADPLADSLTSILEDALNFPIPLTALAPSAPPIWGRSFLSLHQLELFHGPTAAFKDVGARFLAAAWAALPPPRSKRRMVLVATSGDTGGAVAAAFHRRPGVEVVILFPKGRVSARQAHQLCAWGDNVQAFAVEGTFDDCQRIVKEAFASSDWQERFELVSANSISVGRFTPQAIYYAWSSLQLAQSPGPTLGKKINYVIPAGNLGNAVAAAYARALGYPIGKIVLATNANPVLDHYHRTGEWKPQTAIATLANAMDVGAPSNFERLRDLGLNPPVCLVTDAQIQSAIREAETAWGLAICPHTATAVYALRELAADQPWVFVATAHPAKFETVVEPVIGRRIELPAELQRILGQPAKSQVIEPQLEVLWQKLR